MTADRRFSSDDEAPFVGTRRKRSLVNVLRGATATLVIGVLPLVAIVAPVAGGAVAGYLQNGGVVEGVKIGALTGAIGGIGLNLLAPPRLFGLVSGDVGDGFLLMAMFVGFAVWVVPSAFGGALGARLAENRFGSPR